MKSFTSRPDLFTRTPDTRLFVRFVLAMLTLVVVSAHDVSEAFLRVELREKALTGYWDVSLNDLEVAVGIDADHDDTLTWQEIRLAEPRLRMALRKALQFPGSDATAELLNLSLENRFGGTFLRFAFSASQPAKSPSALRYDFMFQYDHSHRAIVTFIHDGAEKVGILTADQRNFEFGTNSPASFSEFVKQGIFHMWEGTDHILFLLALLLPAVLARKSESITFREALWRVLKVVTAFTVAHSITLALATLGLVRLPSRLVESTIALSVLLAAANNIARIWNDRSWLLAFSFGLLHGFGFASVLSDLALSRANLVSGLVGFNSGVEIGQLAIVAIFFPLAFFLRETWFYKRLTLVGGSAVIMLVACGWILERAFSMTLFPLASNLPL